MKNNQIGRSMIEMLGVLAIIAVLSVGGIAGYGKAMEILKFNRYKTSLIELVYNFLQIDNKNYNSETTIYYHDLLKSLNEIPKNFRVRPEVLYDQFNNTMAISSAKGHGSVIMCFHKNNRETRMSCKAFIDVAYNLREHISEIFRYPTEGWNWYRLYGNNTCGKNFRCLRDMTVEDQREFCEPYSPDKQDVMWCVAISI